MNKGILSIVPTPIGNLEDITVRGLKTLAKADIIACEDTRVTGTLLKHFNIVPKQLLSYHSHNESEITDRIIKYIVEGNKNIVLVSDAGTPGISDPGAFIIRECLNKGITITVLPGATALIPSVVMSGMAQEPFTFWGFAPHKKGRTQFLKKIVEHGCTSILYESPNRVAELLSTISELGSGEKRIFVIREISKMFEQYYTGSVDEVKEFLTQSSAPKGEFVIVLSNKV